LCSSIFTTSKNPSNGYINENGQLAQTECSTALESSDAGNGNGEEAALAPKWWKIAKADISGAASGATVGGLFGGIGACIGAVIGGCVGSIAESGLAAPGNSTNSASFNNAANRSNPYDNIGRLHYVAIDEILAKPSGIIAPDGTVNTVGYYGWMKNFAANNGLGTPEQVEQSYPYNAMLQDLASTKELKDLTTFINGLVSKGKMSRDEANVLIPYFSTMERSSNFEAFKAYSVDVERQVNSSESFSEVSKATLLSVMATSRYGCVFWGVYER
jgi:hypothetical protein